MYPFVILIAVLVKLFLILFDQILTNMYINFVSLLVVSVLMAPGICIFTVLKYECLAIYRIRQFGILFTIAWIVDIHLKYRIELKLKMVPVVHSTLKREIMALSQELR